MTGRKGVAISTTGHEHRLGFLETAVKMWDAALAPGDSLFVTVDGTDENVRHVQARVNEYTESVWQVGRPAGILVGGRRTGKTLRMEQAMGTRRLGVAVNKNTGLELLMNAGYGDNRLEHMFLSDDDCWPLYPESLAKHVDFEYPHSMVCWGKSRLDYTQRSYAAWKWPRGVMLYAHRSVVETAGGMDERFGFPGGHEHAEYSQRIYHHGFTPTPFITPTSYATRKGQGAGALWHCEDMLQPGETIHSLGRRRNAITSIDKAERDWDNIHSVMASREGNTAFVPYAAHENGRASAILCSDLTSRGADK